MGKNDVRIVQTFPSQKPHESRLSRSDVERARQFLAEESKGVADYEAWIAATTDENLKQILRRILDDERRHVETLVKFYEGR